MRVGQIYYHERIETTLVITCVDEIYCSWVTSEGKVRTDKQSWILKCCKPVARYPTWQEAVNSFEFNRYPDFKEQANGKEFKE